MSAVWFSPDGRRVIVETDAGAQIFETATGAALLAPLPAGRALVNFTVGPDATVCLVTRFGLGTRWRLPSAVAVPPNVPAAPLSGPETIALGNGKAIGRPSTYRLGRAHGGH